MSLDSYENFLRSGRLWRRYCSRLERMQISNSLCMLGSHERYSIPIHSDIIDQARSRIDNIRHTRRLRRTPGSRSRTIIADGKRVD